jgi:hypothetical protein
MPNLAKMKALLEDARAAYKAQFTGGFYHGSPSPNIKAFDPLKNTDPMKLETPGVTFATRDPDFAESFLPGSERGGYKAGATMYPVSINLGKHWHPNQPESQQVVEEYLKKMYPHEANPQDLVDIKKDMLKAKWEDIENPNFLQHLRDTGHDTFHVMEGGVPNVGVLKPENIRGKFAAFNPEDAASPEIMKAAGGSVEGYAGGGTIGILESLAKNTISLAEREANKAKFLEGTKVVDYNGKPITMYHHTTDFQGDAFDPKLAQQKDQGYHGQGMYFGTDDYLKRSAFGKYSSGNVYGKEGFTEGSQVMPVNLSIKNPKYIDVTEQSLHGMPIERLKEMGHDGVIVTRDDSFQNVMGRTIPRQKVYNAVAFEPTQVKSAIGNEGTFDPTDPRLHKAAGGKIEALKQLAHAVTVPFTHFSPKADLTTLDPRKYGTGMKGAEAARLSTATDIAPRSYFYHGENIVPESGVGGNKYTGVSQNSYPWSKDPGDFYTKSRTNDPYLMQMGITQHSPEHTINNMERMIKEAGYSGYHTDTGTGVLFNDTPVTPVK